MVYTLSDGTQATRRKRVVLTGAASGAQTSFQIKMSAIAHAAAMQADFDDLRFSKADMQTLIDAWLEDSTASTSADVWAEFPTTPANGATEDYWMYYGNPAAANDWDGAATFVQGVIANPSFESLISAADWSFVDSGAGGYITQNVTTWKTDGSYSIYLCDGYGSCYLGTHTSYLHQGYSGAYGIIIDIHTDIIASSGSKVSVECDSAEMWGSSVSDTEYLNLDIPLSAVNAAHTLYLRAFSGSGTSPRLAKMHIDNIRVRKYAPNPPTAAIETEQHQRRTPQFS